LVTAVTEHVAVGPQFRYLGAGNDAECVNGAAQYGGRSTMTSKQQQLTYLYMRHYVLPRN